MDYSYSVVDDFYADPSAVRRLALEAGDWMPAKSDGGMSYSRETRNSFYTSAIGDRLADIVGERIVFDPARMGFGVFALHDRHARVELSTHYDDTDFAAVVYLTPDEACVGGISFLRHRRTGLLGPPDDARLEELGMTAEQFEREVYYPDKLDPAAWDVSASVSMRYNRAVVMRGSRLFHRANSGFGDEVSDGRLSQRFFFNLERGA